MRNFLKGIFYIMWLYDISCYIIKHYVNIALTGGRELKKNVTGYLWRISLERCQGTSFSFWKGKSSGSIGRLLLHFNKYNKKYLTGGRVKKFHRAEIAQFNTLYEKVTNALNKAFEVRKSIKSNIIHTSESEPVISEVSYLLAKSSQMLELYRLEDETLRKSQSDVVYSTKGYHPLRHIKGNERRYDPNA